jgi:hypothetical protein
MKTILKTMVLAVICSLALPLSSFAKEHEETPVQMSDLPEAVQKTIKDKAGDSEVVRIEKETRHGQTVYDAVINKSGKESGIEVDENGKYLKTHDESKGHKEKGEKPES